MIIHQDSWWILIRWSSWYLVHASCSVFTRVSVSHVLFLGFWFTRVFRLFDGLQFSAIVFWWWCRIWFWWWGGGDGFGLVWWWGWWIWPGWWFGEAAGLLHSGGGFDSVVLVKGGCGGHRNGCFSDGILVNLKTVKNKLSKNNVN
jgi:hypothetical protein